MIQASDLIGGRYRLETPIPVVGLWDAWQAVDLIQGRPVAVRLLRAEQAGQPRELERFRAAASLATKVSHQCVAQVFDYGERGADRTPYLVTELVDAPSLAGLLAVGPLEPSKSMDVLARAASGLHAAHAAGLTHGDLKPDSLLVSPDGQVKITDFVTGCWAQAKPAYLAPERAAATPATPASDLYSLGVVGYECLIGARAFSQKTAKPSGQPGRPLPPLPRSVPAAVAGLIDDLTAPDPARRPASAEKVSVRAGLLHKAPANIGDTPAKGPARRRIRRPHDVSTPTPATRDVPTPAPTLVDGQTAILSVPVQAPPLTTAPDRRRSWWPLLVAGTGAVLAAGLAGWLLANAFAGPSPQHEASRPGAQANPTSAPPGAPAARTVELNDAALAGRPVSAVTRQLRRLGLRPRIVWAIDSLQAPGTVITLQPSGRVPAGSLVTVTAARHPPSHRPSGRS